jgi:hypothetical protein
LQATRAYLLLAVVTGVTLFAEIIVTRVFSVVLWYHFAFVAISLAMLGMAGGSMFVHLRRDRYEGDAALAAMARLSAGLGATIIVAYLLNLGVAFRTDVHLASAMALISIVGHWAVPFFLSGMIVSIALTRLPYPAGRLYAADLIGAALGCVAVQPALSRLGPPAALAAAAALLWGVAWWAGRAPGRRPSPSGIGTLVVVVLLCLFAVASMQEPILFSPKWIKGKWEEGVERVYWNTFSRVSIYRETRLDGLLGWGFGDKTPHDKFPPVTFRTADIDAHASTWYVKFDGDYAKHGYLAYDISNVPYHLRRDASVAIVGSGAGRDILAALSMNQRQILGIELNPVLVDLLKGEFADYTGRIGLDPRVTVVAAEARNWIERAGQTYDIIQTTFIDTEAATASGAYALAENTLYTREAWDTFLNHLSPNGLLTFSRWHWMQAPMESLRLTALARATLHSRGVQDPGACVALLCHRQAGHDLLKATILISPSPLSPEDCRKLDEVAASCGFDLLYSPTHRADPYATLLDPTRGPQWEAAYEFDVSAPTDDRPFFFHNIRPRDMSAPTRWMNLTQRMYGPQRANAMAVVILGLLGGTLAIAAVLLVIVPLRLAEGRGAWKRGDLPLAAYFAAIGLGFMFLELAIIQRTGMALGHPVYGLQVTLFSLLLGSGVGSLLSSYLPGALRVRARWLLALVAAATCAAAVAVGPLSLWLGGAPQVARIICVGLLVFVVGLFMGTPFPTGLAVARARGRDEMLPWLWGTNGVCSVIGSFAGTVTGLTEGARLTALIGAAIYVLACVLLWRVSGAGMKEDG